MAIQSFKPNDKIKKVEAPPKLPAPNLATLAHNPGQISSQKRIEAQTNQKPVEDIITAQIVGNDFQSGLTKVRDGGGNVYSVAIGLAAFQGSLTRSQGARGPSIIVGQSVIISRSRSQQGEVTVRLVSVIPLNQNPQDALASFADQGNVNELCKPSQNRTVAFNPKERPEDPVQPEEPPPVPEENPNDPPSEPDPPSRPFGCDPGDPAQWFNGSSCPPGANSLGFATLPNGSTMTLCEGPSLPAGDGCPQSPDEYGWECQGFESCVQVPGGLYATKSECEGNCLPPEEPVEEVPLSGYRCVDGSCIVDNDNPQYDSLASCEAARVPIYGEPPFTGGQCDGVKYRVITQWTDCRGNDNEENDVVFGPIGGARIFNTGSNTGRVELQCRGLTNLFCSGSVGTPGEFTYYPLTNSVANRIREECSTINNLIVTPYCPGGLQCGDPLGPIEGYECP